MEVLISSLVLHHLTSLISDPDLSQEVLSLLARRVSSLDGPTHRSSTAPSFENHGLDATLGEASATVSRKLLHALSESISTSLRSAAEFYLPLDEVEGCSSHALTQLSLLLPKRLEDELQARKQEEELFASLKDRANSLDVEVQKIHRDFLESLPPLLNTLITQSLTQASQSHTLLLQTLSALLLKLAILPARSLSSLFSSYPALAPALASYDSALDRRVARAERSKRELEEKVAEYQAAVKQDESGRTAGARGEGSGRFEELLKVREEMGKARKEVERDLKRLGWQSEQK